MRVIAILMMALLALSAAPAPVAAQPPEPGDTWSAPDQMQRRENREERRKAMRRKIAVIRIARLTEELDLEVETAARLIPLLEKFDTLDEEQQQSRRRLNQELKMMLKSGGAEDAALHATVGRWWENEHAQVQQRHELFDELEDVLTMRQRVRLLLFIPRFRHEVRQLARELGRMRGGHGGEGNDGRRLRGRDHRPSRSSGEGPGGPSFENAPGFP